MFRFLFLFLIWVRVYVLVRCYAFLVLIRLFSITFVYQDDDDEDLKGVRQRWSLKKDKKLCIAVAAIGGTKNWGRISKEYFNELRTEHSLSVRWFRLLRENKT